MRARHAEARETAGGRGAARQAKRTAELARRLAAGPALLLDGATGTELERRGVPTGLPLWSAHALLDRPATVERIHRDYVAAGCEILTANTFRTQRRTLARGGVAARAPELTALAVRLARRAAEAATPARPVWVAGSVPPLEDCYRPDLVPDDAALAREHAEHVAHLAQAGVDLLLVETMNAIREALAATRAAVGTALPVFTSFACDPEGRLLSGEPLEEALAAVIPLAPRAVLVNCVPPSSIPACLPALRTSGMPFGAYANLGAPNDETGFTRSEDCRPAHFAAHVERWVAAGARVVGGCCGTRPAHLRAAARRLGR